MTISYDQLWKAHKQGELAARAYIGGDSGRRSDHGHSRAMGWYRSPLLQAAFARGFIYGALTESVCRLVEKKQHPGADLTSVLENMKMRAHYMKMLNFIQEMAGDVSDLLPPKQPNLELGGRIRCRCPGKCQCR
jgi:hypothetical protein